jgi:two-component system KDP operon response regulator KdpE
LIVEKETPELVILDLGLPDINGFEVLKRIRLFSSVPIAILTVRGDEKDIVRGLELGADEYVVKPFHQMELLARIGVVIRRMNNSIKSAPVIVGKYRLSSSERILQWGDRKIAITRSENIILEQLMNNAGNVVPHSKLAEELWGNDYPDSVNSIKVLICRLRKKIEIEANHPLVILSRPGLGYSFSK